MSVSDADELLEALDALLVKEAHAAARDPDRPLALRVADGDAALGCIVEDERGGLGGRHHVVLRPGRTPFDGLRLTVGTPVRIHHEEDLRGMVVVLSRDSLELSMNAPLPEGLRNVDVEGLADDKTLRRERAALGRLRGDRHRAGKLARMALGVDEPAPIVPHQSEAFDTALDAGQAHAVSLATGAADLCLIHGPPGTGKTRTLVEVVRRALRDEARILAVAPSNAAVDNLTERLVDAGVPAVRLGHPARVTPRLAGSTLELLVHGEDGFKLSRGLLADVRALMRERAGLHDRVEKGRLDRRDAGARRREIGREIGALMDDIRRMEHQAVERILARYPVVTTTLGRVGDPVLGDRTFDLLIVDEATQATAPSSLQVLARASDTATLVLAGDPWQLPPTVLDPDAARAGLDQSLFERGWRAWGEAVCERLSVQYRMHGHIMGFSSERFYEGDLHADPSVVAHLLPDLDGVLPTPFTGTPLTFVDTAGKGFDEVSPEGSESKANPDEARFVAERVRELLGAGVAAGDLAVLTPYAAQVAALRSELSDTEVEVGTIDGYQGREAEAVVISLVRSNTHSEVGFLGDVRRMNVAWTRARRKLVVIGDSGTLGGHPFYAAMLEYVEAHDAYQSAWEYP